MKKRAVFPAVLLLCTCDGHDAGLVPCKENPDFPGSCALVEECLGECAATPPLGWSPPALLWTGPPLMAPECPADWAGTMEYEVHADLLPLECGSCACEPPTGQCGLPSITTISTESCGIDGGITLSFAGLGPDPGFCNTENGVGMALGMHSLWLGPPSIVETGCTPVELPPIPASGSLAWATFARACMRSGSPPCLDGSFSCAPAADPPPGFSQCVYRRGDHDCVSAYPKRLVFYEAASDTRVCPGCSCGPPTPGLCTAYVRTFEDTMCSDALLVTGSPVNSWGIGICDSISAPSVLGKQVDYITYEPGSCEPLGGDVVGTAELLGPTTFCCQQDEEAPHP